MTDPPGPVSKAEYEALAAFRYALRRFLHFSEEAAGALGLTPQQHQALLAIKGYPGRDQVLIGELAERLQVRPHSAGELADRLEAQGYVYRVPGTDDRRQTYLALTPAGTAILARLSAIHREELRRIGPHLSTLLAQIGWTPGDPPDSPDAV
jgi:DNA-binding MarR family transcriptional regulator